MSDTAPGSDNGAPSDEGTAGGSGRTTTPLSILVVIGVSGAGKTTIACMLAQELGWEFQDADGFHPEENVKKMASGAALNDADRKPWLQAMADWIDAKHKAGTHGVLACSALKRDYRAVLTDDHGDAVRIVYLDGTYEQIARRVSSRHGHFMPPGLLESQFETLEVPDDDENPVTVSIEGHPHEIVARIVAALKADLAAPIPAGP